jgi:hypothetical protein
MTLAPPSHAARTCSPRRAKSAERIDGASSIKPDLSETRALRMVLPSGYFDRFYHAIACPYCLSQIKSPRVLRQCGGISGRVNCAQRCEKRWAGWLPCTLLWGRSLRLRLPNTGCCSRGRSGSQRGLGDSQNHSGFGVRGRLQAHQ